MKTLELTFTKGNKQQRSQFFFEQERREGNVAIYKRKHQDAENPHFEVIRIGSHNGFYIGKGTPAEVFIEPAETYPTAEQWGTNGWTYNTIEEAVVKYKAVLNNENMKEQDTVTNQETGKVTQRRGRKPVSVEFPPNVEFKMKDLAAKLGVSVPLLHIKKAAMGSLITKVREEAPEGRKGRCAGVFIYTPAI